MKIAIPTTGGSLSSHFGHCEKFALLDIDHEKKTIRGTEMLTPPPHEAGLIPKWLMGQNIDIVITKVMGEKAKSIFSNASIKVITGSEPETPEAIAAKYLAGTLETLEGSSTCGGHDTSHACTGSCTHSKVSCAKSCSHGQH